MQMAVLNQIRLHRPPGLQETLLPQPFVTKLALELYKIIIKYCPGQVI